VTDAERAAAALMVSCGFCWAVPGTACGQDGLHLARYVRGYRRGLISQEELAVVCGPLKHVSAGQIVVAKEGLCLTAELHLVRDQTRRARSPGRTPSTPGG
jgi:hypothetical protein